MQAASNTVEGRFSQYSALRIGWTTGEIGVRGGPSGIPWAGFLRKGGVFSRGGKSVRVPGRDYMAMPKWIHNYWYELVEQGLQARMAGYKSYRGEYHGIGGSYR